jgi:hypothetical protein
LLLGVELDTGCQPKASLVKKGRKSEAKATIRELLAPQLKLSDMRKCARKTVGWPNGSIYFQRFSGRGSESVKYRTSTATSALVGMAVSGHGLPSRHVVIGTAVPQKAANLLQAPKVGSPKGPSKKNVTLNAEKACAAAHNQRSIDSVIPVGALSQYRKFRPR